MTEAACQAAEQLIYLVSCAVHGTAPEAQRVAQMSLENVYEAAKKHQITAIAAAALASAGCSDPRFQKALATAQRRELLFSRDRAAVLAALEQAGIWYMPLKGVVLKSLYPGFGLREMADNDILYDAARTEDVRKIMLRLGFTVKSFAKGADDIYYKPPVSNFEMHRKLFTHFASPALTAYYGNVKERLQKDPDNGCGYHFSDEDFYIYLTAHEYKHWSRGGTGLRSLLDIYVYLQHRQPDWPYILREVETMGIAAFEKANRALALRLFAGETLEEEQKTMLAQIVADGVYGKLTNVISRDIQRKGRAAYFFSRLTLPYASMLEQFPLLQKAPVLYPVFWTGRLLRGMTVGRKKAYLELQAVLGRDITGEQKT